MLRHRSRVIAASVAAVTVPLAVLGCQTDASGTPAAESAGASESAKEPENIAKSATPCLVGGTTLVGDLDGDGHPDKITNPGHTGTKMTIQWGSADGSFGEQESVKDLVGAKEGEIASAAIADFQNDGSFDIVINIVEPSLGDDSATARLAEFRPGPLKRSDLSSPEARHSDIGDRGEVEQLAVANYGDDAYPDLAIRNNPGDGQLDRDVRISQPGSGPGEFAREAMEEYGEYGARANPPAMPTDGWKHFHKPCP